MYTRGAMEAEQVLDLRVGVHQRYRHTALCFLERGALMHPAKVAVVDEVGSYTYGQLFGLVRSVGTALAKANAAAHMVPRSRISTDQMDWAMFQTALKNTRPTV